MSINILLVDPLLLSARTTTTMYEAFDCRVTLASGVEQALEHVRQGLVDVVIASCTFVNERGMELRAAIKAVRPDLCIAAIGSKNDHSPVQHCAVDVFLRATHFFSDLRQCGYGDRAGHIST